MVAESECGSRKAVGRRSRGAKASTDSPSSTHQPGSWDILNDHLNERLITKNNNEDIASPIGGKDLRIMPGDAITQKNDIASPIGGNDLRECVGVPNKADSSASVPSPQLSEILTITKNNNKDIASPIGGKDLRGATQKNQKDIASPIGGNDLRGGQPSMLLPEKNDIASPIGGNDLRGNIASPIGGKVSDGENNQPVGLGKELQQQQQQQQKLHRSSSSEEAYTASESGS